MKLLKLTIFSLLFPITIGAMSNQAPKAMDASFFVTENQTTTVDLRGYVQGGKPPYTFVSTGQNSPYVEIIFQNTGLAQVISKNNYTGSVEFQYKVIDAARRSSNVANIRIHINGD